MDHDFITPQEMREAEARASSYGLDEAALMENAGRAVARVVEERFADIRERKILVVCGLGNNGGDGLVAARYLSGLWRVRVLLLGRAAEIRTKEASEGWRRLGPAVEKEEVQDESVLLTHRDWFAWAEVILDSILGTGARGEVRQPVAAAIGLINASKATKVAIDIPSGLDPSSGVPGSATVRADITVTLHRAKTGLRGKDEYTGEVIAVPIGIRE
ncbi:MAG: NAD(P)H-hydrate epimerase [Thaumarchaeota archaeon]|nr:NAD(P)H-hydrate epimerase [Nitrososphaerota archaeon]